MVTDISAVTGFTAAWLIAPPLAMRAKLATPSLGIDYMKGERLIGSVLTLAVCFTTLVCSQEPRRVL